MAGHLADLYRHAPIGTLVLRDLRARYRGSLLGFLWSFLNPLLLMLVYALVFRSTCECRWKDTRSSSSPDCSVALARVVARPRGRRHRRLGGAGQARPFFPAEILPLVSVLANLINMLLSLPLLFVFLLVFGSPHAVLAFLPLLLVLQLLLTTGLALALAALNVRLRDVEQILTTG